MTIAIRSAHSRRADLQTSTREMGIDDAYVSALVDEFYDRVRAHRLIGPIFEIEIGDGWDHHLDTMKSFWASVAYNAGQYSGKPRPAHTKLKGVQPWHFAIWLALFEKTLKDTAPSQEVVTYFMVRARRIAASLQSAMFIPAETPATL